MDNAHAHIQMLCYVIIKGDPFSHGLVSMGDPTVQGYVKQGQDNTKHAHSKTKTDKTNGHNTYTQRSDKEHVTIFMHKQTCTCTYSLVDVV